MSPTEESATDDADHNKERRWPGMPVIECVLLFLAIVMIIVLASVLPFILLVTSDVNQTTTDAPILLNQTTTLLS